MTYTAPAPRVPGPKPQIVVDTTGWDGRKTAPRYLADLTAAAAWLTSPDFAMIADKVRAISIRILDPPPAAESHEGRHG